MGKVALICSPDGAKSSYEIGVLKALKELKTQVGCSAGAFVGSINAVLTAQNDLEMMVRFWKYAFRNDLFRVISSVSDIYVNEWEQYDYHEFVMQYLRFITPGNQDVMIVRELLKAHIDESKVRNSGIECAIVGISPYTFDIELYPIEEIPEGQLVDYVICSVLFPVISVCANDSGGSLPYMHSPYKAVEVYAPTFVLSTDESSQLPTQSHNGGMNINIISPTEMLDFCFNETAQQTIEKIRLGYMDTLKKVSFSYGKLYYINKLTEDGNAESVREKLGKRLPAHLPKLIKLLLHLKEYSESAVVGRLNEMLKAAGVKSTNLYVSLIETAAELLEVDKNEKYTDTSLREAACEKLKVVCQTNAKSLSKAEDVMAVVNETVELGSVFVNSDLFAKYFLILLATDPRNYDGLEEFIGSFHLKTIIAIVTLIYLIY